jgi:hypothetical protein
MLTFGVAPNAPVAVTDEFVVAEDDDDADADEEGFDEPQPARTAQASKGIAMSARKRRMKNLNDGGCQLGQPTGTSERRCRSSESLS